MSQHWKLSLTFIGAHHPELFATRFESPLLSEPVIGTRAQYASRRSVSFKWSKASTAVAILALRIKLSRISCLRGEPVLEGGRYSAAHILANQVYVPSSASELFGVTQSGESILRRIITVANGRLRGASPVQVFVKDDVLEDASSISVTLDGRILEDAASIQALVRLLSANITPARVLPFAEARGIQGREALAA